MVEDLFEFLSKERKRLQAEGELPEWYTTQGWQLFKQKYLSEGDKGFKDTCKRISSTLVKHLPEDLRESFSKEFFEIMWKGWLAPSTPVAANTGTNKGFPVSCSGGVVGDAIPAFYEARKETAVLTQKGFGTSAYLGGIRPRGSKISRGGTASGTLPVFKMFAQDMRDVSQGTSRRGAWAGYLPIDHDDFFEVCSYLRAEPDDLNIGWCVSDAFISRLEKGDEEALHRYQEAMLTRAITGKGYFYKSDHVHRQQPKMYHDLGLEAKASNLCTEITLHADEEHTFTCQPAFATVISQLGEIIQLGDVKVGDSIWSNERVTKVTGKVSSGVKPVYRYKTSAGEFVGTEDHRIIQNGVKVEVRDADKIDAGLPYDQLVVDAQQDNKAILQGLLIGDGTYRNGRNQLCVGEKDLDYYEHPVGQLIENSGYSYFRDCEDVLSAPLDLTYERLVPEEVYYGARYKKINFLRGLFSANGSVRGTSVTNQVSAIVLKQSSERLIRQVQEMLFSVGIPSRVYTQKGKNVSFENGEYLCRDSYHLCITTRDAVRDFADRIGFIQKYKNERVIAPAHLELKSQKAFDIVEVEYLGDYEVFHIEVDNESHTYNTGCLNVSNCVLSSMNLAKYDEWKDTDAVFTATVFLDCVASELIALAEGVEGMERSVAFTKKSRALGLGALGFHTYLQDRMIPIEGFEAHRVNVEIFKHLNEESLRASKWMAEVLGEPEWCKGYGVRNTHRLAIAPNTSSALLCGGVSQGIEPVMGNAFVQGSAAGNLDRANPSFIKLLKKKGIYTKELIEKVARNSGSIQNMDEFTEEEKLVFKTFPEIDQGALLRLASTRQPFICQAQSLNLAFAADEDPAYISAIHKQALLDENIKSLYYLRSMAGVTASKGECVACEG